MAETRRVFVVRVLRDPYVFPTLQYIYLRARNEEEAKKRVETESCYDGMCIIIDAYPIENKPGEGLR